MYLHPSITIISVIEGCKYIEVCNDNNHEIVVMEECKYIEVCNDNNHEIVVIEGCKYIEVCNDNYLHPSITIIS
jgi:hypothetical protein